LIVVRELRHAQERSETGPRVNSQMLNVKI
jgi:hypothetical protein